MAAAPIVSTDDTKTDPAASASTTVPNPLPIVAPPVTVSNANTMTAESAQTPTNIAQPPVNMAATTPRKDVVNTNTTPQVSANSTSGKTGLNAQAPAPTTDTATATDTTKKTATTAKAAAPAPTSLELQADALAGVNDTIKSMSEGDDPIATREFNMLISGIGPQNQMALEGMAMKLKQQNLDGQGAGTALLAMMARDQGYDQDQLVAKIGADSAKRLYDFNTWGFSKAQEINTAIDKQNHDNLSLALQNGQYDTASGLWDKIFPGIPFDVNAAKVYDPVQQQMFAARSKLIDTLIQSGDSDGAKKAMLALAQETPQAFGFKTSEEAVAALQGVDFSKETWANNQKFNDEVNTSIRTAALQGDRSSAMLAIDRYYANKIPGAASLEGASALKSMSLDDINAVLKANDKAPITEAEKASIDSEAFAKDNKYAQEKKSANGANATDMILNQIVDIHPNVGINPAERDAARAWIFDNLASANVSPDGNSLAGFTFKADAALPPWDNNSVSSHLYTDWPTAIFYDDGEVKQITYAGGNPYSTDKPRGDVTTTSGAAAATADKNYEAYVMDTRVDPSTRLNRQDWFYATKGGQQSAPIPELLPKDTTTPTTPPPVVPALAQEIGAIGTTGGSLKAWLADNPSGTVSLPEGGSAQVQSIVDTKSAKYGHALQLSVGGKVVLYNPERGVYLGAPTIEDGSSAFTGPHAAVLYKEYKTAKEAIAAGA